MFYGSAREHDMDWGQFSIMFRSIFWKAWGDQRPGEADPKAPCAKVSCAGR